MPRNNLSIILKERPTNELIPGRTFGQETTAAPTRSDLKDGDILVEVLYLSLDPAMRSWLNDSRSYVPPVAIGATMRGLACCRVLASKNERATRGDIVSGQAGWTQYAILHESQFEPASNFPGLKAPQDVLSALGITSVTAWVGMTQICDLKRGELVVISGAAGATGSIAGQIAKIKGARVVGICGSDDKCKWLIDDIGFDVAINYKSADFKKKFEEATRDYIDVYFDNVGGEILDMCLAQANKHARFIECGLISQYNTSHPEGPRNFGRVIQMRIRMQGFIVFDHMEKYPQARHDLSQWLANGKIRKSEHILKGGLQVAEQGLVDIYKGINKGKLLVEVKNPIELPAEL